MQINAATRRVYTRKEFNSQRTGLGYQHDRHFIVLGHQYGGATWRHVKTFHIQSSQEHLKTMLYGKIEWMSTLHGIAFDVDMNILPPVHTIVSRTINPSDSWQYTFKISLRSRRLEVVGTRKTGRARRRHARGEGAHPSRVSLARARSLLRLLLPSACYAG